MFHCIKQQNDRIEEVCSESNYLKSTRMIKTGITVDIFFIIAKTWRRLGAYAAATRLPKAIPLTVDCDGNGLMKRVTISADESWDLSKLVNLEVFGGHSFCGSAKNQKSAVSEKRWAQSEVACMILTHGLPRHLFNQKSRTNTGDLECDKERKKDYSLGVNDLELDVVCLSNS